LIYHQGLSRNQAREKALKLMQQVGIPDPEKRFFDFPHRLSGGMRQRIVIAMALSCSPKIILADEPTTALDVTIQAQILNLLQKMQETNNMATILITHDLGLVARTCQRVNVMYAGKIVEQSTVKELFNSPLHPYTQGLLDSLPRIDKDKELLPIRGTVPDLLNLPPGCAFHPRCKFKKPICQQKEPPLLSLSQARKVKCWLYCEGRQIGR
jgi:oligopeptide/dipeptide ABC transporter ATP-binding protein